MNNGSIIGICKLSVLRMKLTLRIGEYAFTLKLVFFSRAGKIMWVRICILPSHKWSVVCL